MSLIISTNNSLVTRIFCLTVSSDVFQCATSQ